MQLAPLYDPAAAGIDADLRVRRGPLDPVLARLDPGIAALSDVRLTDQEFMDLVTFLREGLLDPNARRENLCRMIPARVPSGLRVLRFQGCPPCSFDKEILNAGGD